MPATLWSLIPFAAPPSMTLQVRWAVLNVAAILKRHPALHEKLADAMDRGESTASCIALIEQQLALEGAYS